MNGLKKNANHLFGCDGKLFLAAFDHPQIYGAIKGLEKPFDAIDRLMPSQIDGYILNPGIIELLDEKRIKGKKLVLRASLGGTMMGTDFPDWHCVMCSPRQAIRYGVDAILIMLVLGGAHDKESMAEVAKAIDAFHDYSIPVMVEVLAADYTKNNDTDFIRNGVRIGAELGADAIKAFYCKDFKSVVDCCPVPVVLAGGPKESDICSIAKEVVEAGACGFAFGRNLFQSDDPVKMVEALNRALRG